MWPPCTREHDFGWKCGPRVHGSMIFGSRARLGIWAAQKMKMWPPCRRERDSEMKCAPRVGGSMIEQGLVS